jgi:hypothetical protein
MHPANLSLRKAASLTFEAEISASDSPRMRYIVQAEDWLSRDKRAALAMLAVMPQLNCNRRLNRHTGAFMEYLHFFPAEFLKQSTAGRNINYLTGWLEFKF